LLDLIIGATSNMHIDGTKPVLKAWATQIIASIVATYEVTGTISNPLLFQTMQYAPEGSMRNAKKQFSSNSAFREQALHWSLRLWHQWVCLL
jgi:hypothetical protein